MNVQPSLHGPCAPAFSRRAGERRRQHPRGLPGRAQAEARLLRRLLAHALADPGHHGRGRLPAGAGGAAAAAAGRRRGPAAIALVREAGAYSFFSIAQNAVAFDEHGVLVLFCIFHLEIDWCLIPCFLPIDRQRRGCGKRRPGRSPPGGRVRRVGRVRRGLFFLLGDAPAGTRQAAHDG